MPIGRTSARGQIDPVLGLWLAAAATASVSPVIFSALLGVALLGAVLGLVAAIALHRRYRETQARWIAMEQRAAEAEERLLTATDAAQLALWDIRLGDGSVFCNDRLYTMHGLAPRAPVDPGSWSAPVHPEDRARVEALVACAITESSAYRFSYRTVWPDQSIRHIEVTGTVVGCPERFGRRLLGVARDITEHKRLDDAVRLGAEKTRRILDAAGLGLWEWDLRSNEVYFSPEWKRQLGYDDDEITHHFSEWESRAHPDDLPTARAAIDEVLAGLTARATPPRFACAIAMVGGAGSMAKRTSSVTRTAPL